MTLTSEQFQEIISKLVSDRSSKVGEKRREPRVGARFEGKVTPLSPDDLGAPEIRVIVRDISPSGINILCHKNMKRGTGFILELPTASETVVMAQYEVRHSKMLNDTLFSIGAHLVSLSGDPADNQQKTG